MEGRTFTVREAANIMGCEKSTIYQLLEDGWLSAPPGGSGRGKERDRRVTEKSLFQFMILDRLSRVPIRTLKAFKNGRKYFDRLFSKNAIAKQFYSKGTDEAESVPDALPQEERKLISKEPTRCRHHDFVAQYHFAFRKRARQLAPDDKALQDDLVQEMSLAVLEYDTPASHEILFGVAANRAKMYLRYEAQRGMLSLDEAQDISDKRTQKAAGLSAYIDELLQRGVPRYWIDEVIGYRLDVA